MRSVACRNAAALLLRGTAAFVVGLSTAGAAETPLAPETILEEKFEGRATVEFLVDDVHELNIDALFVPDISHDQIIKARIPGSNSGQEFMVIIKRNVATRLLKLGIEDCTAHFRGKMLRVSGTVERIEQAEAEVYRVQVTHLDQLESIRKP